MADINWIQVGAGFLSGGAFGALIKQFFDYRKNRIQAVTYNLEVKPFYNQHSDNPITSKIVIKDGDKDYKFQDLYIGSLSILNTSNQDYSEFSFGLTYDNDNKFIQFQQEEFSAAAGKRPPLGSCRRVASSQRQSIHFEERMAKISCRNNE